MEQANLPRDIQHRCIWLVRGYDRCRKEYADQRAAIISGTGCSLQVEGHGGHWNGTRGPEQKAARLEALEKQRWVIEMHALERARDRIGAGLPEEMRETLKTAIFLNCNNGKKHPFERLYTIGISRRGFYRHRAAFLADIAAELNQTHQNDKERGTDAAE